MVNGEILLSSYAAIHNKTIIIIKGIFIAPFIRMAQRKTERRRIDQLKGTDRINTVNELTVSDSVGKELSKKTTRLKEGIIIKRI